MRFESRCTIAIIVELSNEINHAMTPYLYDDFITTSDKCHVIWLNSSAPPRQWVDTAN